MAVQSQLPPPAAGSAWSWSDIMPGRRPRLRLLPRSGEPRRVAADRARQWRPGDGPQPGRGERRLGRAGVAEIGDAPVDVLLNVAAIVGNGMPELEVGSSDWSVWQEVFNTVTIGPLRVLQAFLPRLRRGDKVINVTSQVGTSMWLYGGTYVYGAAKAALNRLTLSLSLDLADRGIIVGLVHPGWMKTDMGGPNAETPVEESAAGIRRIVADWPADGRFHFLKWTGEPHVW